MQATDTTEAMLEERGVELSTMRTEIWAALDALRDAWDGAGGNIVRYPGVRTEMLIGGGTSWGEDIEACTQINLFWESGTARARASPSHPTRRRARGDQKFVESPG